MTNPGTEPTNEQRPIESESLAEPQNSPANSFASLLSVASTLLIGMFIGLAVNVPRPPLEATAALLWGVLLTLAVVGLITYICFKAWGRGLHLRAHNAIAELCSAEDREARRPHIQDIIKVALAYLAFAGAMGLILTLITNLVLVTNLMIGYEQVDRLTSQNTLIDTSNTITVQNRLTQVELDSARVAFDRIDRLLDVNKSIQSQRYALSMLPAAMVMPVHRVAIDEQGKPKKDDQGGLTLEELYPNLEPLKERLVRYLSEDRIGIALQDVASSHSASGDQDAAAAYSALRSLRPLTNDILNTLHRLGAGNQHDMDASVWHWTAKRGGKPVLSEDRAEVLDLRHLSHGELEDCQLPFADFCDQERRVLFPPAMNLRHAYLAYARLESAPLQDADLTGARLRSAHLANAILKGATFGHAYLQHADLDSARLQGADLHGAVLLGADLGNAHLQGATLSHANLRGADLSSARLIGAQVNEAKLHGADLAESLLQGASLRWARLQGADLQMAQLQGADLTHSHLQGSWLNGANLEGTTLRLRRERVTSNRTGETIEWFEITDDGEEYEIPAALLANFKLGQATLERLSSAYALDAKLSPWEWKLSTRTARRVRWPSREDAITELRHLCDLDAEGDFLTNETTDPTSFGFNRGPKPHEARLNGVFLDLGTKERIKPGDSSPSFEVVLERAAVVSDPGQIQERSKWRFPGRE